MPKLDIVPIEEARVKTASGGKRAQILQAYLSYMTSLRADGRAGSWQVLVRLQLERASYLR